MPRGEAQKGQSPRTLGEERQTRGRIPASLFVLRVLLEGLQRPLSLTHLPEALWCHQPVIRFEVLLGRGPLERGWGVSVGFLLILLLRSSLSQLCQSCSPLPPCLLSTTLCQLHKHSGVTQELDIPW